MAFCNASFMQFGFWLSIWYVSAIFRSIVALSMVQCTAPFGSCEHDISMGLLRMKEFPVTTGFSLWEHIVSDSKRALASSPLSLLFLNSWVMLYISWAAALNSDRARSCIPLSRRRMPSLLWFIAISMVATSADDLVKAGFDCVCSVLTTRKWERWLCSGMNTNQFSASLRRRSRTRRIEPGFHDCHSLFLRVVTFQIDISPP